MAAARISAMHCSARHESRAMISAFVRRRATLIETRLEPHLLELEISENVLMRDAEYSKKILDELKLMGIKLAVDDFGTSYSSLSYLQQFPIDALKIDQSFIQKIESENDEGVIISAIISMANSLKLNTYVSNG